MSGENNKKGKNENIELAQNYKFKSNIFIKIIIISFLFIFLCICAIAINFFSPQNFSYKEFTEIKHVQGIFSFYDKIVFLTLNNNKFVTKKISNKYLFISNNVKSLDFETNIDVHDKYIIFPYSESQIVFLNTKYPQKSSIIDINNGKTSNINFDIPSINISSNIIIPLFQNYAEKDKTYILDNKSQNLIILSKLKPYMIKLNNFSNKNIFYINDETTLFDICLFGNDNLKCYKIHGNQLNLIKKIYLNKEISEKVSVSKIRLYRENLSSFYNAGLILDNNNLFVFDPIKLCIKEIRIPIKYKKMKVSVPICYCSNILFFLDKKKNKIYVTEIDERTLEIQDLYKIQSSTLNLQFIELFWQAKNLYLLVNLL